MLAHGWPVRTCLSTPFSHNCSCSQKYKCYTCCHSKRFCRVQPLTMASLRLSAAILLFKLSKARACSLMVTTKLSRSVSAFLLASSGSCQSALLPAMTDASRCLCVPMRSVTVLRPEVFSRVMSRSSRFLAAILTSQSSSSCVAVRVCFTAAYAAGKTGRAWYNTMTQRLAAACGQEIGSPGAWTAFK